MTELATPPVEQQPGVTRISHWIGGRSVPGTSGRTSPVFNPATGRQTGALDLATVEEVDQAVQAAKQAFESWRTVSLAKRAELFFNIRELVHERREEVAKILTSEHGKVLSDAMGEVTRGLEVIEFCCGLPTLLKSEFSEQASTGIDVYSIRQPLGVVAGHHAVQLPGDGADVDVGAGDRVRQHVRAEAVGEGSVGVDLDGRAAEGGRPARRRVQRRARRQGRGRRGARASRTSPRSRSSARRRSRSTSTRRRRRRASAARRSAARRTT